MSLLQVSFHLLQARLVLNDGHFGNDVATSIREFSRIREPSRLGYVATRCALRFPALIASFVAPNRGTRLAIGT